MPVAAPPGSACASLSTRYASGAWPVPSHILERPTLNPTTPWAHDRPVLRTRVRVAPEIALARAAPRIRAARWHGRDRESGRVCIERELPRGAGAAPVAAARLVAPPAQGKPEAGIRNRMQHCGSAMNRIAHAARPTFARATMSMLDSRVDPAPAAGPSPICHGSRAAVEYIAQACATEATVARPAGGSSGNSNVSNRLRSWRRPRHSSRLPRSGKIGAVCQPWTGKILSSNWEHHR